MQSTIVPLSRAGKHTICESTFLCSGMKYEHSKIDERKKKLNAFDCMSVMALNVYDVPVGNDEQLFSRSSSQVK